MPGIVLLVVILFLVLLALPSWPYSRGWGYYPSGIFSVLLLVLIILLLLGYL